MSDRPSGSEGDRPGLDVNEWIRLVGEVQRLGIDTARSVAARFGDLADSSLGSRARAAAPVDAAVSTWRSFVEQATDPEVQQQFTAAASTLTSAFIDMMQAAWDLLAESSAEFGFGRGRASSGSVDLGSIAQGERAVGEAYVTVGPGTAPDSVKVRVGDMTTSAGDKLADGAVTLDPESIVEPSAGRSYPVSVKVVVPRDATPGTYHGFLFAGTEPEGVVALHLEVVES